MKNSGVYMPASPWNGLGLFLPIFLVQMYIKTVGGTVRADLAGLSAGSSGRNRATKTGGETRFEGDGGRFEPGELELYIPDCYLYMRGGDQGRPSAPFYMRARQKYIILGR
jgi:hypothetical protein